MHLDRRHHASRHAQVFQGVLEGQGIDHGREHSHLIARHAVHIVRRRWHASKDIATAKHQADLHAGMRHVSHFSG